MSHILQAEAEKIIHTTNLFRSGTPGNTDSVRYYHYGNYNDYNDEEQEYLAFQSAAGFIIPGTICYILKESYQRSAPRNSSNV